MDAPERAETLLRAIIENTTAAIFVKRRDGRYTLVNGTCERLWGRSREELLGRTDFDVLPRRSAEALVANDRRVFASAQALEFEERIHFPGGERWFISSKVPIVNAREEVIAVCGVATEITDRKRAELALREGEARFRTMAESTPILLWMSDRAKKGVYFNQSWLRFTGRTLEEELGDGWLDGVHPEDLDSLAICGNAFETRAPFTTQFRLRHASGAYRWVLDSGAPRHGPDGRFEGYIGSCVDITDRRQAEEALRAREHDLRRQTERLEDLNERKNRFLATLAHELRNPLAPIQNASQLLETAGDRRDVVEWASQVIHRQVRRMARLVDDLLDVARITRGVIRLRKRPVSPAEVITRSLETVRPLLDARRHTFSSDVATDLPQISADPERLEQILANLLENAAKYTEKGGSIHLRASVEEDHVVIRVRDNGRGIAPEQIEEVFQIFSRATPADGTTEGLGLGLTIVNELALLHGGSVSAHSAGKDQGSEFTVRLPLREPDQHPRPPEIAADEYAAPKGAARILLADDNRDAAESLSALLRALGHTTLVLYRGRDVLAGIADFRPEVAVLDLGLPDLAGLEVARRVRAELGPQLTLVALTGFGNADDRAASRLAGFDHHLVKPAPLEELLRIIRNASRGCRRPS